MAVMNGSCRTMKDVSSSQGVRSMRSALFLSVFFAAASHLSAAPDADDTPNRNNQENQSGRNEKADRGDREDRTAGSIGSGHWKNLDHCFATCVSYGNQEEVALAQIAKQKAKSNEVKQFADMMIRDHQEFLTKLQKFAPEASQAGILGGDRGEANSEGNRVGANQTVRNDTNTASTKPRIGDDRSVNNRDGHEARLSDIERELAEQCVASARRKLESKSGDEFDKCYMSAQIAKHMGMKDKLTVYQRHASGDLAKLFADGLKTTEHHLMKAEEIAKSLEGSNGTTSRRESNK